MYYADSADEYYYAEDGYEEEGSGEYEALAAWPPEPVQCANGPTCKFLALGVCRFYHPEAEEEAAEEAWDESAEDWQAWEEPAAQEPKVFKMVVPPSSAASTQKQPVSVPGPRWNVLVNSQATPAKATKVPRALSASRSPRRRRSPSLRAGGIRHSVPVATWPGAWTRTRAEAPRASPSRSPRRRTAVLHAPTRRGMQVPRAPSPSRSPRRRRPPSSRASSVHHVAPCGTWPGTWTRTRTEDRFEPLDHHCQQSIALQPPALVALCWLILLNGSRRWRLLLIPATGGWHCM